MMNLMKSSILFVMTFYFLFQSVMLIPPVHANPLDQKIAIVGAGPSGLTAARYLAEKGYSHVTVFEKNSEVGGKVFTYKYEDLPYDMGAVFLIKSYDEVEALAREFGMTVSALRNPGFFDEAGKFTNAILYLLQNERLIHMLGDAISMQRLVRDNPELLTPDFLTENEDFYLPVDDFPDLYPNGVYETILPVIAGTGTGFPSEMPAIYYLKLSLPIIYPLTNAFQDVLGFITLQGMFQVLELHDQVNLFGCTVEEIIMQRGWDTFPHVDKAELQNGFYHQLDDLQGDHNTYYVSLAYGVNETMKFTKHILDNHFIEDGQ